MKVTAKTFNIIIICLFMSQFCYANPHYEFIIKGVAHDILDNIKSRLKIEKTTLGDKPSIKRLNNFSQRLPTIIQKAIAPYGYFKPVINVQIINGSTQKIYININPGPPVIIKNLQVKVQGAGRDNKQLQNFLKHLPLKSGGQFRTPDYTEIKTKLFKIANAQGYINAHLETAKVYIDRNKNTAVINLDFHTGNLYFFGKVMIESDSYDESFIRRFINITSNMPFSSDKLIKLQQDMVSSFYFEQVTITPDFKQIKNYHVPIQVSVRRPKAKKFSLGLGYGTFTGIRMTAGMALNQIGDKGQHLTSQLKLSQVTSGFAIKYYIPTQKPLTDQWTFGANYQKFKPKNGQSNSATFTAGYTRQLNNLQMNSSLNYLVDRYRIFDPDINGILESHFSKLFYPNINFNYTKTNDLVNPTYGRYAMLNIQGASKDIFSTNNFLQTEAKAKFLFSPTSFSKIILRGDLGYTITDDIKQLPLSMRFFAGGLNSVRGYFDSSIGPGRYLAIGSIEYQNHIYGNWDGAIFYDVGNAMNHWGEKLKHGEGVGIIYRSVIGPIKVYVSRALNKNGKPKSIEFSIGPEF